MAKKMQQLAPLLSSPCAPSPLTISYRSGWLSVGCCIPPSRGSHCRTLYFHCYSHSILPPKTTSKLPPPRVPPSPISSRAPPPTAETIVRLIVTSAHRISATQDRCSVHLSIFRWVPFGRPKQGNPMQHAKTRPPAACIRLIESRGTTIQVHGGWIHEDLGWSRWGSFAAAHLVLCVVVCEVCVCCAEKMYSTCHQKSLFFVYLRIR